MGGDLQHVFFNNSGSEAIDTVIRLARYYWQAKGEPNRNIIIARVNGYHGSTIAGASLGGMKHMHDQGGPWLPGIEHVMQPYQFNEGFGEDPAAFGERAAKAVEDRILEVGPENVAAFVGEPVQGAGGVIIPPDELLAADRGHLPQVRHPAGLRRGDLRLRPAGTLVRLPALRGQARPGLDGQGPVVRLPADLGGGRRRPHRRDAARRSAATSSTATPTPATRPPRRWR